MPKKTSYLNLSERKLLLRLVDSILVIISLWFANIYFDFYYVDFTNKTVTTWILTLVVYILLFGEIFQLYNLNVSNNKFLVVRSIVITTFVTTIVYVFTPIIAPSLPENRLQIVYFFLLITLPVILWRFIYMWSLFSPKFFKNILIIGHSSKIISLLQLVNNDGHHSLSTYISNKEVEGFKNFTEIKASDISKIVEDNGITEVILSTSAFEKETKDNLNRKVITLFEQGVNIKSFEAFYEELTDRIPKEYLNHNFYKNIHFSRNNTSRFYLFFLRTLDIIVSVFGLLFFILLVPFILIGNLIGNRGALFYGQERVGKNAEVFKILKLRSMVKDAEKNGAVWAQKNDTRVTSFGKFLRLTRLDEIPQFFNILKGEMSLIGPRPERPEFVKDLVKEIPFYAIRHVIKPGLTGWAQVNYTYASTIEEQETKLRYDLYYIKKRNTFLDFKIFIKTISTVLFFKGQ